MIYVHLATGFEEVEAVTIADVLRRAGLTAALVSITGDKAVTGAHGITVTADMLYEEADYEACEMIVLPGGMPGTANLGAHEGLVKHIRCFAENDKYVAAICAAPMVLGAAGVLDGKKATIYPGMEDKLGGGRHKKDPVVIDGKLITSMGPGTAMLFALELVRQLAAKEICEQVKKGLLV